MFARRAGQVMEAVDADGTRGEERPRGRLGRGVAKADGDWLQLGLIVGEKGDEGAISDEERHLLGDDSEQPAVVGRRLGERAHRLRQRVQASIVCLEVLGHGRAHSWSARFAPRS